MGILEADQHVIIHWPLGPPQENTGPGPTARGPLPFLCWTIDDRCTPGIDGSAICIITVPWPARAETQNIDEHAAIPDFSVPAEPLLIAHVV